MSCCEAEACPHCASDAYQPSRTASASVSLKKFLKMSSGPRSHSRPCHVHWVSQQDDSHDFDQSISSTYMASGRTKGTSGALALAAPSCHSSVCKCILCRSVTFFCPACYVLSPLTLASHASHTGTRSLQVFIKLSHSIS